MLAYSIARKIEEVLDDNESVTDVLQQLNRITKVDMVLADKIVPTIPTPPPEIDGILKRLKVQIRAGNHVPSKKSNRKIA
jgi:hypothetical protein